MGIDIGAVSASAAIVIDDPAIALAGDDWTQVTSVLNSGRRIYVSSYRRTRGKPLAAAQELMDLVVRTVGSDNVTSVCLTGSGSKIAAATLGARRVNEFKAIASALRALGVQARTVFEVGGESSKYLRLKQGPDGYDIVDYATNGDCAAGTGSFIDQQAGRLKYRIEDIGALVAGAQRSAQVAGRCSVFAKSDMIHAQQKGYTPAEVLGGLCVAVARNFRTAVVRSHPVEPPVALIGGVAANSAVVAAIQEAFGLDAGEFLVPDHFAEVPAIGAAVVAAEGAGGQALSRLSDLRAASDSAHGTFPTTAPLSLDNVVLLRNEVTQYRHDYSQGPIDAYMGIDIGSVSTNVVVIDDAGRMVAEIYTRTLGRPIEVVAEALKEIESQWGDRLNIRGVGTTGSGRELIGALIGADAVNDEITAHKTGANYVGSTMLGGRMPDTIFEIGGQDSKYISLDRGVVVDFTMNEACAAGTGSFLEERAEELDIAIKNEFAALAMSSRSPIRLGERCTVFMERDVNSYLQRGASKADLVAGLAYSVVYNYINRVVRGRKIGNCIFFQGGTAYNDAVAAAFAAVTGKQIIVPPHNGVIGAIGSALLARDKMTANGHARPRGGQTSLGGMYVSMRGNAEEDAAPVSNFRGYDMAAVDYSLREFTCKGCSNHCQIQEFNVEGDKTYWGDKCSDRYRKAARSHTKPVIEDLMSLRRKWMMDDSFMPDAAPTGPRVGLPNTMFALEWMPLWRTLLSHLGMQVVLSEATNKKIVQAGLASVVAEPCFPIIVAHGHVADLADKGVDYIFMPNIISSDTQWRNTEAHLCPWHQTLPFVVRRAPALRDAGGRFLTPVIHFREGRDFVCREFVEFFRRHELGKRLGLTRRRIADALKVAFAAQDAFNARRLQAGRHALRDLANAAAPGIVLLGRPYNIHDAGVNLSVAAKLRDNYGVNCIPQDFLDTESVDVCEINAQMYWALGRKILAAGKIVARHDNLHIIYITNFKCGPDSFIKHFVTLASGKPFLTLQFDGHSNDAGMMTRCEAYLDSKGILRPWRVDEKLAAVGS
ncbi:MAG: acyl-CoA dehydratase activase [Planctomycetaceae bacterium]|nr:acyl-CoA dehydratase activase [Planctomycetaceae bacterium]